MKFAFVGTGQVGTFEFRLDKCNALFGGLTIGQVQFKKPQTGRLVRRAQSHIFGQCPSRGVSATQTGFDVEEPEVCVGAIGCDARCGTQERKNMERSATRIRAADEMALMSRQINEPRTDRRVERFRVVLNSGRFGFGRL
ncbi:MAG: hypothetical protein IPK83_23490 [Planctomycetes bacterium]|nr:hypothetical protein [Planctomycetota bacterium]